MTDLTTEIRALAFRGIEAIYRTGYKFKKAGVMLSNLSPAETVTRRLWDDDQNEKLRKLMEAMDSLNRKLGRDTIRLGVQGLKGKWRTKFGKRSPRYTTKWSEIMTVK